jgi:hypothetical protein
MISRLEYLDELEGVLTDELLDPEMASGPHVPFFRMWTRVRKDFVSDIVSFQLSPFLRGCTDFFARRDRKA